MRRLDHRSRPGRRRRRWTNSGGGNTGDPSQGRHLPYRPVPPACLGTQTGSDPGRLAGVTVGWDWQGKREFLDMIELQVDRGNGWETLAFDTTPGYIDTAPIPT